MCSDEVTTTCGGGVWRTIRSFWPILEVNIKVKVGRGIRFYSVKKTGLVKDLFKVCFLDFILSVCIRIAKSVSCGLNKGGIWYLEGC